MECPKCESTKVERLPPSPISPHPGYRCGECGTKLRAPGMLVAYIAVLVVKTAFARKP
jgi:hypothetical protein